MVVTVFGLGFVGLTTALGFAEKGHRVYGIEVDLKRAADIAAGRLPFLEPGLFEALTRHLGSSFSVTEDIKSAVGMSDIVYYCVGTPYGENGEADLTYLYAAIDDTLAALGDEKFRALVIKSTVPPSTTKDKIIPYVNGKIEAGHNAGVANNPEFLREGRCWDDFLNADRIVLGVDDARSEGLLRELYAPFDIPVFAVSLNTAEYIKYLSNTFLAAMISYSNEMAEIAYQIGDIQTADAFRILHLDKRWGGCSMTDYVYPGCGYGGYCLPKDTNALYALMNGRGVNTPILGAVIATNEAMADIICGRIARGLTKDARIGILGLSFKPESDDVRETPAAKIIQGLLSWGFTHISAYDPAAAENFKNRYGFNIDYKASVEDVAKEADVLVILTAWKEFINVSDFGKPVVDCRYML
jgi:UDPglucose 6-dehydrogenase